MDLAEREKIKSRIAQLKQEVEGKIDLIARIEACLNRGSPREKKEIQQEFIDFCRKRQIMGGFSIPDTEEDLLGAYLLFSMV